MANKARTTAANPDDSFGPVMQSEGIHEKREPIRMPEGERVRRRRNHTLGKFHIPPELIPAGLSIEWKRDELLGKPDYSYERELLDGGWRPVEHSMFDGLFAPPGTQGPIRLDGMILMERPQHLTDEAKREDYARAVGALRAGERSMAEAPAGTLQRTQPSVRTSIEPIPVPDRA